MKTILLLFFASLPVLAAEVTPAAPTTSVETSYSDLRKREHRLAWDYSSGKSEIEVEGSDETETTSGQISFDYGYNFGRYELGATYGFGLTDDDSAKNTTSGLTVYGRFNFIDNVPGENLIPYIALGLQTHIEKYDPDTGSDIDFTGSGLAWQIGLSWFPFGEIFAVEFSIFGTNIDGDIKSGGSKIDGELRRTGGSVGYSIYF